MKVKKFKKWLRDERLNRNLTQTELAKALGMCICTVHNLEQGKTLPHIKHIGKISTYFGVSVSEIRRMLEEQ